MVGLIKKTVDQPPAMHFLFQVEQPSHAVHECRRLGIKFDRLQVLQKLTVAIRDDMHPLARSPVARRVNHAAALLHLHGPEVVIQRPSVEQMHLQPQRLPDPDLVIQFRVRPAQPRGVADDADFLHSRPISQC